MIIAFIVQNPVPGKRERYKCISNSRKKLEGKIHVPNYYGV